VAKHAGRHRKRKKRARRALRGRAVSMAGLVAGGLVLVPHTHPAASASPTVHGNVLLAADSVVFIDGNNYPTGSTRMGTQLQSKYTQPPYSNPSYINNTQVYPGTLGLYNGLGKPTGDQSIADGQQALDTQIKQTRSNNPTGTVTVVAFSEGAVAASHEHSILQQQGYPSQGLSFVLIANAERPNGGILARMPTGTYIPLLGITGGNATSSDGAPVVMVTRQYDGIADAPAYPVNVVADANALLGAHYLHGNGYYTVNSDPTAPGNIVTTSPNGNMTDILVTAPPGQLPILMPLAQAGVPQPILVALDPATRAIIETGYARSNDPSQQVRFQLLPPVSAWPGDAQSVVTGVVVTVQLLPAAVVSSVPNAPSVLVVTPLQTTSQAPSLPPVNTSLVKLSASQWQPNAVTNPATNPGTNVVQQAAPTTLNNGSSLAVSTRQAALDPMPKVTTPKPLVKVSPKFTPKPTAGSASGTGPISTAVKGAVDFNGQLSKAVSDALKKPTAN
jgi:hypothetical protein